MKKILSYLTTFVFILAFIVALAGCGSQPTKPEPVNLDGKMYTTKEAIMEDRTLTYNDLAEQDMQDDYFTIVVKSQNDVRMVVLGALLLASYEGEGNTIEFTVTEAMDGAFFEKGDAITGEINGDEITIKPDGNTTIVVKEDPSRSSSN